MHITFLTRYDQKLSKVPDVDSLDSGA